MRKTKTIEYYTCDKCGEDIESGKRHHTNGMDLCPMCLDAWTEFLAVKFEPVREQFWLDNPNLAKEFKKA